MLSLSAMSATKPCARSFLCTRDLSLRAEAWAGRARSERAGMKASRVPTKQRWRTRPPRLQRMFRILSKKFGS